MINEQLAGKLSQLCGNRRKDIGCRNWDKMRDERRDNAILSQNRWDVVVVRG